MSLFFSLLFRYIPGALIDKLEDLSEESKNDINALNIELVHKLKATDGAFSLGEYDFMCSFCPSILK